MHTQYIHAHAEALVKYTYACGTVYIIAIGYNYMMSMPTKNIQNINLMVCKHVYVHDGPARPQGRLHA